MTNSMAEVFTSNVVLAIGTNTTWNHPVFGAMLKQAVKFGGTKLIVCDPRRTDLVDFADVWLQHKNGSDVALLCGLQHIILREGWAADDYIATRTEGLEEYQKSLEFFTPEKVAELTGISPDDLFAAAKLYATGGRGALYYCMGITQHSHGVDNVKSCVNTQLITGNLGFEGGGVNPLRGQNNVQGACDMGGLPNVFTGYQPVNNPDAIKKFSEYWGAELNPNVGQTLTMMIPACGDSIRALFIMGENPMVSDPNLNHVKECLEKLDLLIVQDIVHTETTAMADVVLPAVSFAEKQGTTTNTERRVQLSNVALTPRGITKTDYEIIADLAALFGQEFARTPEAIFREITDLTPSYAGLTYERIKNVGIQWPCPNAEHPGTKFLHKDKFVRGLGVLTPMTYKPPAEETDAEWDMVLSTGRILQHFHTGSMSRRSEILNALVSAGHVELHPVDAEKHGIKDGEMVQITTRRGSITTQAKIVDRVAVGSIFVPFHFAEAAANMLTNDALDPVAKIPEYKVAAARIARVSNQEGQSC